MSLSFIVGARSPTSPVEALRGGRFFLGCAKLLARVPIVISMMAVRPVGCAVLEQRLNWTIELVCSDMMMSVFNQAGEFKISHGLNLPLFSGIAATTSWPLVVEESGIQLQSFLPTARTERKGLR